MQYNKMNAWSKLSTYARDGSLWKRIKAKLGHRPVHIKVRWFGADSVDEAIAGLIAWGQIYTKDQPSSNWLLCLGEASEVQAKIVQGLNQQGVTCHAASLQGVSSVLQQQKDLPVAVLCSELQTKAMTQCAQWASSAAGLSDIPFEYAEGAGTAWADFAQWDEYADTFFVSPVLRDTPDPYALYGQSLSQFEQKCGIRDYLDFYQMLRSIGDRGIQGAVAEFGSYKGHSGWLMAQSLKALDQQRDVYLFDMFEHFPDESLGIDRFWSNTHTVDYEQVKAKFSDLENVTLVKGDFTQTLKETPVGPLAMAYVDCDSYRATRYLFETILDDYLVPGGVLICEDYGHPALLGSRVAVHEILDQRTDLVRFYSQFSGLYIAVKVSA